MMISLFIRKKNNKFCVIYEYRDEVTKKRRQKQLGAFEKKKDANTLLAEERLKIDRGLFVKPNLEIKLHDWLVQWNNEREDKISITTYSYYKSMIKNRYNKKSRLGNINIKDITPNAIEVFYSELRKEGLAKNTIAKHHKMLNKAFVDAKRRQLIYKNPCEYVEKPASSKSTISKILTVKEAKLLLDEVKNTPYELPVNLALGLGLRAGEIFGLTWDNINFENKTIFINKSLALNKETNELFFKDPKTASSKRRLFIPEHLNELLKKYKEKQKENAYNLVLVNRYNKPQNPGNFSKTFGDFLKRNKLEQIRFHDLRHTNASLHLKAGTDLKVTSKTLGHSTIGITADLYTHVLQELDQSAANNINSILYSKN